MVNDIASSADTGTEELAAKSHLILLSYQFCT